MGARPRVVFLTDIVTPYMVAMLDELAKRVDLAAVFCCANRQQGRRVGLRRLLRVPLPGAAGSDDRTVVGCRGPVSQPSNPHVPEP